MVMYWRVFIFHCYPILRLEDIRLRPRDNRFMRC